MPSSLNVVDLDTHTGPESSPESVRTDIGPSQDSKAQENG
jgi:hypothetical protein